MIQVTEAALNKVKEEVKDLAPDQKEHFIRLKMGMG